MAILVKKGDPNPTPTFGSIGTLGTAGIHAPVTSTVIPSGATPTVPSGGVAPSSPTSITQPTGTSTVQKPVVSPPSTSSPITSTLVGAGAGAIAGNLLNAKTGKTLTDLLGITKPATKPTGGATGSGSSGVGAKPITGGLPSLPADSTNLGGGYYQDSNGNMYDGSGNLVLSSNGENGYIYFGDPNHPVYFDKDYNEISNPDTGIPYIDTSGATVVDGTPTDTPSTTVADSGYMMDEQGNIYDSEGNFISYADGSVYDPTFDSLASDDTQYLIPYTDEEAAKDGGLITMMKNGGNVQRFADGGDVSQDLLDAGYSDNGDGTYSTTLNDGSSFMVDSSGNPVISNAEEDATAIGAPTPSGQVGSTTDSTFGLSAVTDLLKSGGVQGALVGSLIAQLLNSSGSSGGQNKGVDMSKVGALTPRTTNFGIGPANVVTADQYRNPVGTGTDIYGGTDLYHNLNAPGFNPVNPEPTPAVAPTAPPMANGGLASSGQTHYTFGKQVSPMENMGLAPQAMKSGGLPRPSGVPMVEGRNDYRMGAAVSGAGTGQSDDIPAMLADGEYVLDSDLVSMLGDGSNKAGSQILDKWREEIRRHKRSAPVNKIPPPAKSPLAYMKGIK